MGDLFTLLDAGHIPPGFERLLAAGLGEPDIGVQPSAIGKWLTGLVRRGGPNLRIGRIERMDDAGFFRTWWILRVFLESGARLEAVVLPTGWTFGLFAVTAGTAPTGYRGLRLPREGEEHSGARALYLNRRRRHVEAVLRDEGRPLTEANSRALAEILLDALCREGNGDHTIVDSAAAVANFNYFGNERPSGYEVDAPELERVGAAIAPPAITADDSGWLLRCHTLFGWMHTRGLLKRTEIRVRYSDWGITVASTVLSQGIFRSVPFVKY